MTNMNKYEITARFDWGEQTFSFPHEFEALNLRDALLLCNECILVYSVKIVKED